MPSRREVLEALVPYAERHLRGGGRLNNVTRHILGLYHGRPRARAFRRYLSERTPRDGTGIQVLREAIRIAEGEDARLCRAMMGEEVPLSVPSLGPRRKLEG